MRLGELALAWARTFARGLHEHELTFACAWIPPAEALAMGQRFRSVQRSPCESACTQPYVRRRQRFHGERYVPDFTHPLREIFEVL